MSNQFLETQIIFDESDFSINVGEKKYGEIILTPKKNLKIQEFGFELLLEIRGRISVQKKILQHTILAKNETFLKGEIYRFDFDIKGSFPPSYQGKNVDFNWSMHTFFKLKQETYSFIRNTLLQNLKLFKAFSPESILATSRVLYVHFPPEKYHIKSSSLNLKSNEYLILAFFLCLIIIPSGIFFYVNTPNKFLYMVLAIILLCFIFVPNLIKEYIVGKIFSEVTTLTNQQFLLKLAFEKNNKHITKIEAKYRIVEKVVDDRGTSSSTYKSSIFVSKKLTQRNPDKNIEFTFDFPSENKNVVPSFYMQNINFYWQMEITTYFDFGGSLDFYDTFFVSPFNIDI